MLSCVSCVDPFIHCVPGALVYVASSDHTKNENWLGEAPPCQLAAQIAGAHGPSGPNDVYLFRIADAMRKVDNPGLL